MNIHQLKPRRIMLTTRLSRINHFGFKRASYRLQQPVDEGENGRSVINPQTSPRPSFSSAVISGRKKDHHSKLPGLSVDHFGRDHYELVKMLNTEWEMTQKELNDCRQGRKGTCVEEFVDKEENPSLRYFKPFDWDSLCLTRLMPVMDGET